MTRTNVGYGRAHFAKCLQGVSDLIPFLSADGNVTFILKIRPETIKGEQNELPNPVYLECHRGGPAWRFLFDPAADSPRTVWHRNIRPHALARPLLWWSF